MPARRFHKGFEPYLGRVVFVDGNPIRSADTIHGSRHEDCRYVSTDKFGPVYDCKEIRND